jgi:hypothetical protein
MWNIYYIKKIVLILLISFSNLSMSKYGATYHCSQDKNFDDENFEIQFSYGFDDNSSTAYIKTFFEKKPEETKRMSYGCSFRGAKQDNDFVFFFEGIHDHCSMGWGLYFYKDFSELLKVRIREDSRQIRYSCRMIEESWR